MSSDLNIPITVRFHGRSVPAAVIARVLSVVDDAAFKVESSDLKLIRELLPGIGDVEFDAAKYRFEKARGATFTIASAGTGSIVLTGVLIALGVWILENTVGESLTDSWKESGAHAKLVKMLSARRFNKSREIARTVEKKASARSTNWPVRVQAQTKDGTLDIEVTVLREDVPADEPQAHEK